jgi:hypothetical protein
MGVSGQCHTLAALYPGKEPPVPIIQEAGWASEPVRTQRLEEKSTAPAGDRSPVVQSVVRHFWKRSCGRPELRSPILWNPFRNSPLRPTYRGHESTGGPSGNLRFPWWPAERLLASVVLQKETPSDVQLHLAALQGDVQLLRHVLDSGKVHVDSKDKVRAARLRCSGCRTVVVRVVTPRSLRRYWRFGGTCRLQNWSPSKTSITTSKAISVTARKNADSRCGSPGRLTYMTVEIRGWRDRTMPPT